MYKEVTSISVGDDLYIGFDCDRRRRQRKLPNKKVIMGKYHNKMMLRGFFGLAEHQQEATRGLRYKLTITGYGNKGALKRATTTTNGKILI